MPTFKQLTDFFIAVGADNVSHTEKTYLAHAIGVYQDLKSWGAGEELCRAGMFHSIYGTEKFQRFALPVARRDELRELIGRRAEWLAYVNCAMDRASLDRAVFQTAGPYRITDRLTGAEHELPADELDDLCRIHLCDWLEQVPRSQQWDYRRAAYRQMATRLGGVAQDAYERVFGAGAQPA